MNLSNIEANFKDKDEITPKILMEKSLIKDASKKVKILGNGKLTLKSLTFKSLDFSKSAREQVEKNKGVIK